jgi:hypothetical protein
MRLSLKYFLVSVLALQMSGQLSRTALAADFIFVAPNNSHHAFQDTDPLAIELPEGLMEKEKNAVFVELDGVDVTQTIALEGTRAVFYPASPYAAGAHSLRLVRMGRNGKLIELNRWSFNVVGGVPPVVKETSVEGGLNAAYSYMAAEGHSTEANPAVRRNNLESQGTLQSSSQLGRTAFTTQGNAFFNSDSRVTPARENAEIGEYLLRARNTQDNYSTTFSLGSHDLDVNNMLVNKFYRRGASAKLDVGQGRAEVTGFAMNTGASFGNQNFTGVEYNNRMVEGIHLSGRPSDALADRLELESTFYQGHNTTNGVISDGNGLQLGAKSQMVKDFLSMRWQYGQSNIDADGKAGTERRAHDNAYAYSFTLTPLQSGLTQGGLIQRWTLDGSYLRTGSLFESLLNTASEKDRATYLLNSNYIRGGFSLDNQITSTTDNIGDSPLLPRNWAGGLSVQASYSPETEVTGRPVFSFGGALNNENRLETPAGYLGIGLDRQMAMLNGGVTLSFEKTIWSFNQTYSRMNDNTTSALSYYSHFSDLSLSYTVNDRVTLNQGLQVEVLNDNSKGHGTNVHFNVGGNFALIPEKLWNNTNYSSLIAGGKSVLHNSRTAETEFTWMLKAAEKNSAGYAVAVSGLYNDTGLAEESRGFVRLKLTLPFSY